MVSQMDCTASCVVFKKIIDNFLQIAAFNGVLNLFCRTLHNQCVVNICPEYNAGNINF